MKNTKKKGFTLIELIVVIAILGILAVIAVPKLSGFSKKAQISADKSTFDMMSKNVSIAVANGDITGNVTGTVDAAGVVTLSGATDPETTAIAGMFETKPTFKLKANEKAGTITWTVGTDGVVTPPVINATTGEVTIK